MDVAILTNGLPPSDALRAVVFSYIDDRKPPEADCMILAPVQIWVAIAGTLFLAPGAVLATVLAQIQIALAAFFSTLKPGDVVYRNRLITIISDVSGVADINLTTPAANVTTMVDATHIEIPALGAVVLGV